ncbi:hypothetical protein [Oceanobacter antarcticus]|uniref:Uncharacterized protein n=1 Tax=Oceanobacter antarcticus TaxID=3133425 RepID=A0ABW8NEX6_9GAMM
MTFKVQINEWWDGRLAQLESIKLAHEDGALVRFDNGAGEEAKLTEEQSKALLSDLAQLVEEVLKQNLPEFTDDRSDVGAAFDVYEWHQDVCGDLEAWADEMDSPMASSASTILIDLLKLPFTLSED